MVEITEAGISWGEASLSTCHSKARGNQVSFGLVHQDRRLEIHITVEQGVTSLYTCHNGAIMRQVHVI